MSYPYQNIYNLANSQSFDSIKWKSIPDQGSVLSQFVKIKPINWKLKPLHLPHESMRKIDTHICLDVTKLIARTDSNDSLQIWGPAEHNQVHVDRR